MSWNNAEALEREVRRLAEALWGGRPGSAQRQTVEGRERDCLFYAEDLTHYVECTISRSPKKINDDSSKMVQFRDAEIKKGNVVKLWIITGDTPGADQVAAARKHKITILSVHELRLRLFNGESYLQARRQYRWGSATNPRDDSSDVSSLHYQYTSLHDKTARHSFTLVEIAERLVSGDCATLLGDYGMGKSMLIRELFMIFTKQYRKETGVAKVPVAINLRDHWGQSDPHEVLSRHARKLGFDQPTQLIRAYNAGEILLLIDGFDEIVGTPVASRRELRRLRLDALAVVRQFVSDLRGKSGVIVAGRQNFFDTDRERRDALGMRSTDPVFELAEFSALEAEALLEAFEVRGKLPLWLPRRPLFLAYLASHGLLTELSLERDLTPADAWEKLIEAICVRETKINEHLEARAIRGILEALADVARGTESGRGPLNPSDFLQAYAWATGYDEPDEHIRPLLMRLPGLSSRSSEDGSREFLDESMLNALRAFRMETFLGNPYDIDPRARNWAHGVSDLGLDIVANRLREDSGTAAKSIVAARQATDKWASPTLAADLVRLGQRLLGDEEQLYCRLRISNGVFEEFDLSESPCSKLTISGCEIRVLTLPSSPPDGLAIEDCIIEKVVGIPRKELLPSWIQRCDVEQYDNTPTNASILLDAQLPMAHRVLLTILRKLYLQKGAGRKENALSRGLPSGSREFVPRILDVMRSREFVSLAVLRGNRVWYPDRSRTAEVHTVLNDYARSRHPLVVECEALTES